MSGDIENLYEWLNETERELRQVGHELESCPEWQIDDHLAYEQQLRNEIAEIYRLIDLESVNEGGVE